MGAHTIVLFRVWRGKVNQGGLDGITINKYLGQLGLQEFCRKFFKYVKGKIENFKTTYSGKMLVFLKVLSRMAMLA